MSDLIEACRAEIERRRDLLLAGLPLPWNLSGGGIWDVHGGLVIGSFLTDTGEDHDLPLIVAAVNAFPAVLDWCEQTITDHTQGRFNVPVFDQFDEPWQYGCIRCKRMSTCEPIRSVCAVLGVETTT